MPSNSIKTNLDNGAVDPKEAAKIEASIKAKEAAPSTSEQTPGAADWKRLRDELGQPYDAESVPLRKLRQMRRDPMIAFALYYTKVPLVRAQWHMEATDKDGPNAQVAAFMDAAWRKIHARFMFQCCMMLDFGFQAIVKRFAQGNPGGIYEDPNEADPEKRIKPIWDEGNVDPIIWKSFVTIRPEVAEPVFDPSSGEFAGINYQVQPSQRSSAPGRGTSGNQNQRTVDVYKALWMTNDRDSEFGSLYGFPRIAHAFRYWWSYWYNWAQRDRAFERMATPPLIARHPPGKYTDPDDPTSEPIPYQEIALDAAERLRANAIAAVPSTLASSGLEERGTQMYEWDFKFMETPSVNFDHFNQAFNYLDVMKLRSCFASEQAFIESAGGTSSYNVASSRSDAFNEAQGALWDDIADQINRYLLPQLLIVNFPEFVNNGGSCRIVGHGFQSADLDIVTQLVTLIGQADPMLLGVDIREALRELNVPLLDAHAYDKMMEVIANRLGQQQPGGVPPGPGNVGVLPAGTAAPGGGLPTPDAGSANGGSVPEPNAPGAATAGFSDRAMEYLRMGDAFDWDYAEGQMVYVQPNESITLSAESDFIASLPQSKHYQDKAIKALAAQMRRLWASHFRSVYTEFSRWIVFQGIALSDEEEQALSIELAEDKQLMGLRKAQTIANRLIKQFTTDSQRLLQLKKSSATAVKRILTRAISNERKAINRDLEVDQDTFNQFLDSQIGLLIKRTDTTVRDELRAFLVDRIREGKSPQQISTDISEHFSEFPGWKANRVARSETRDAVNAGTLIAAKGAGVRYVRARDGEDFDKDCKDRNGKLFTIREAWNEMRREHSNGTLGFEPIMRANFSIEIVPELPEDAPEDALAWYNEDDETVFLHADHLTHPDIDDFLKAVGENVAEEIPA